MRFREFFNIPEQDPGLNILFVGSEACQPGHSYGATRNYALIHLVKSGCGRATVGGHTANLKPGQAFMIFPDQANYYEADAADPWTYHWISFSGSQVDAIAAAMGLSPEQPFFWNTPPVPLAPLADQWLTVTAERRPGFHLVLRGLFYQFCGAIAGVREAAGPSGLQPGPDYAANALAFIHANYQRPLTVSTIAQSVGLDRSYFSNLFRASQGVPPKTYLNDYRMSQAKTLLITTRLSIQTIGESVGFPDYGAFAKRFYQSAGQWPAGFRKNPGASV